MLSLLNNSECVLGVDPGTSGAVCILGRGVLEVRRDFKTKIAIAEAIDELSKFPVSHIAMEAVHAFPGQGVVSVFTFGRAAGVADGALALALPKLVVEYVSPQRWQGWFRNLLSIGKDREFDSREIAAKIVPESSPYLSRKKDHNSADAVLIAAWKLFQLAGNSEVQTPRSKV